MNILAHAHTHCNALGDVIIYNSLLLGDHAPQIDYRVFLGTTYKYVHTFSLNKYTWDNTHNYGWIINAELAHGCLQSLDLE